MTKQDGLASNSLGAIESTIMGIAGTAPAFSVAVTTAAIVASVGVLSVGSILYCGLIMFGIMLAFIHLSKITPHAGATYAWVGHVFGMCLVENGVSSLAGVCWWRRYFLWCRPLPLCNLASRMENTVGCYLRDLVFWNSFIVFIILLIISKSDLRELYLGDRISNLLLHESRRICVCMALPKKIR